MRVLYRTLKRMIERRQTEGIEAKLDVFYAIVALITGWLALVETLGGSYLANRRSAALVACRLEQLERKVQAHNNLIERTYKLKNGRNFRRKKSPAPPPNRFTPAPAKAGKRKPMLKAGLWPHGVTVDAEKLDALTLKIPFID